MLTIHVVTDSYMHIFLVLVLFVYCFCFPPPYLVVFCHYMEGNTTLTILKMFKMAFVLFHSILWRILDITWQYIFYTTRVMNDNVTPYPCLESQYLALSVKIWRLFSQNFPGYMKASKLFLTNTWCSFKKAWV